MIVGIDLGTTNSSISAYIDGALVLIPNAFGETLTPSVVSFDKDGSYFVGAIAKERLVTHPEDTFKEFKRNMGTDMIYKSCSGKHKPEDLSALVLKQLKADAERYTGETINDAVISVPAYFTDKQREATRNAGLIAGLNVICLVNEPSAAALTYHVDNIEEDKLFLVFDFGGGTLDVTLVDAFDNIIEIESISGDNNLGGADFNRVIAFDISGKLGLDWPKLSPTEQAILFNYGEEIKQGLTEEESITTRINFKGEEMEYTLSRQGLLDLSGDIFSRITIVLKRLMNDAQIDINSIDGVIMIGGSSKMPLVQLFVNTLFEGNAKYEHNGDTIVCEGAGIVAGIKERATEVRDIILTDIAPFSLGVKVEDGSFSVIIPKNRVLPSSRECEYTNTHDRQKYINFEVFQGENLIAEKNEKLGSFKVPVEERFRGGVKALVRFSYDINGIFDIDITGDGVLKEVHSSLGNNSTSLTPDLEKRREELAKLKVNPMSQEENALLIERAGRVAEECNLYQRRFLEEWTSHFIRSLEYGKPRDIRHSREQLEDLIVQLEKSMFTFSDFDADLWEKYIEKSFEEKADDAEDED